MNNSIRHIYKITGFVQGVGFRPFIYRIAHECGISGFVRNLSWGVEIEAQGDPEQITSFEVKLRSELPPLAEIHSLEIIEMPLLDDSLDHKFFIIESGTSTAEAALISPDVATCTDCLRELNDPSDRRYHYPFINCTNCGPRFTIIEEVPYDRAKTTMHCFPLCSDCEREYRDPVNRRFHAEPVACPVCGPHLAFVDGSQPIPAENVFGQDEAQLQLTIGSLKAGKIVAVKGLGGFHLVCDATNEPAVFRLRQRKHRPDKPLAIMVPDLDQVRQFCFVSESEANELKSFRQPILLLKRRASDVQAKISQLADSIAPNLNEVGVMLPYTPLHHLLFQLGQFPALVMTSGNRSEEPIVIDNDEAIQKLSDIADDFLLHNRVIWNRCDDSVGYFRDQTPVLTRRARGFAPRPVPLLHDAPPTLAVGAMYCNVFALAENRRTFLSQHIGDVDSTKTLDFLAESVDKLKRWLQIDPELIVHDLHPDLLTTRYAQQVADGKQLFPVQHHQAHFASALTANGIAEPTVGIVFDGTGFGTDRTIWGGEFFVGSIRQVERVGHLLPLPLPGGDAAIRRPARVAIAYIHTLLPDYSIAPLALWNNVDNDVITVVRQMVDQRFNTIPTSSIGRLFDAVSALLSVRFEVSYEGQAAIELESLAERSSTDISKLADYKLHFAIEKRDNQWIIQPKPMLEGLINALIAGQSRADLAYHFHHSLAEVSADISEHIAQHHRLKKIVLCGGVFQNRLLTRLTASNLRARGLEPVLPGIIPVNDGGIALGQVAVAAANRKQ